MSFAGSIRKNRPKYSKNLVMQQKYIGMLRGITTPSGGSKSGICKRYRKTDQSIQKIGDATGC